jgi:CRISPR/Cas system CSM-associated protein Csm3 (group 7 of RAMP superfamily)
MDKICNKCGEIKNIELFAKGGKYADGRRNYCKQCHSKYVTQYIKNNPSKRSKPNPNRKFKRHGLSEDKYLILFNIYNGMCHACKERDGVNIDHDHSCCPGPYSCGKCVRGVLCNQCNTALGLMNDSVANIKNLIKYIDL